MTADDITTPDISIRDLEQRWGLSRNGLKARAKALGVELVRVSSTCTVWPGDYIDLGDRLHEHISAGNPLGTFPGLAPDRSDTTTASSAITKKEQDTAALVAAIASAMGQQQSAPSDPLKRAKGLAEAADHQLVLTTDELVALGVKGVDGFADGDEAFGYRFSKHRQRNRTLWTVERSIGVKTLKQLDQAVGQKVDSGRQVGFAAHLTSNTSGISLFAATTIS